MADWSRSLWIVGCRELVILADNDQVGREPRRTSAAMTHALDVDGSQLLVKILTLPRAPVHAGDVVDWLAAGHDAGELEALVAASPTWSPERLAEERQQHRKDLRQQPKPTLSGQGCGPHGRPGSTHGTLRTLGLTYAASHLPDPEIRSVCPPGPDIRSVSTLSVDGRDETQRHETLPDVPLRIHHRCHYLEIFSRGDRSLRFN